VFLASDAPKAIEDLQNQIRNSTFTGMVVDIRGTENYATNHIYTHTQLESNINKHLK